MESHERQTDVFELFTRGSSCSRAAITPLRRCRWPRPRRSSRTSPRYARRSAGPLPLAPVPPRRREEFEAVVERYPVNDYAHFCLGRALTLSGRPERARRHLAIAANLRPDRARLPRLPRAAQRRGRLNARAGARPAGQLGIGRASAAERVAAIGPGLLVLLGVAAGDDEDDARRIAAKLPTLRIFADAEGRMNEPLGEREILCVSQFTLLRRRPQGQPSQLHRRRASRAGRAALRARLRAARREDGASSGRGWLSSWSTTAR